VVSYCLSRAVYLELTFKQLSPVHLPRGHLESNDMAGCFVEQLDGDSYRARHGWERLDVCAWELESAFKFEGKAKLDPEFIWSRAVQYIHFENIHLLNPYHHNEYIRHCECLQALKRPFSLPAPSHRLNLQSPANTALQSICWTSWREDP
jgi:hypothetical protein